MALAIAATTNPFAEEALKNLSKLANAEAHSTIILPYYDEEVLKKLFVNVTHEPVVFARKLK